MGMSFSRVVSWIRLYRSRLVLTRIGGPGKISLVKGSDGIAEIVIENNEKRNAISGKMMIDLADIIKNLENWKEGKAVLIRGAGGHFCSGGDLDFVQILTSTGRRRELSLLMTDNLTKIQRLPLVSFAFIQGAGAFGGGAEVAISSDFRIMHKDSKIGFVHSKMGIGPAWGAAEVLKNLFGKSKTLKLFLEAKVFNAEEATKEGLIDFVVNNDDDVRPIIQKIVQQHFTVVQGIKKLVNSDDKQEQGAISTNLLGGPANIKAIQDKIKHN